MNSKCDGPLSGKQYGTVATVANRIVHTLSKGSSYRKGKKILTNMACKLCAFSFSYNELLFLHRAFVASFN